MTTKQVKHDTGLEAISEDRVYPLRHFYRVSGLKEKAVNQMRIEATELGCPFHVERYRRIYIIGRKFIEYLNRIAGTSVG